MNDLILTGAVLTMTSVEIAELVESRHDSVKRTIERLVSRGVIELPPMVEVKNVIGQTVSHYDVDKRSSYIIVAQLSPEFTARLVDRWQELENEEKALAIPNFADPAAAARAWAEQYERAKIAERTKAEIGTRREATAMNTASQYSKKANKLQIELDRAKQYCSIKRMSMLYHGMDFDWRELKAASAEMGLPVLKVFDANYGTVNTYHADVWAEVYALSIEG